MIKPGKPLSKKTQQYKNQIKTNKYSDLAGLAIIILLGIIIYSNSFGCSFHFDDFPNIVYNANIRDLLNVKAWWGARAIGFFTFSLNFHFNHYNIWGYHFVNLLIHLINALLVWWITLLIFSSPALKDQPISRGKKTIAILTALMFVSHPLATQSVTYIIQRFTSLVAMFYFLSMALYMQARLSDKGNIPKALLFTGSLISAILAMFTKENAFTLPFAIVLVELFILRTKKLYINFKDFRVILVLVAFLGLILIIPLNYSFSIFKPIPPSSVRPYTLTPINYFLTQFSVIVKYIQLLILPVNQNFDYNFPISGGFFEIRTLLSFLALSAFIVLAVYLFNRNRVISFCIAWFFLTLLIESSIIPINDVIFEHRTYLPSFGFFLILSSWIYLLLWEKQKYLAISIFIIIIGSYSYLTYERNKIWENDLTLWNDVVGKTENYARPFAIRGFAYGALGQWDNAIADYSRAIGINPTYTDAYSNRGVSYGKLGELDKAISDYSMVIRIDPRFADAYINRGVTYCNRGKWEKAISDLSKAIELKPASTEAYANRGIAWCSLGLWDKGLADYSSAIAIDPKYTDAWFNRGNTYARLGQWENAISDYSRVIEIEPNLNEAYTYRDIAYRNLRSAKGQ